MMDRRTFLKIGTVAGGGLLLGFRLDSMLGEPAAAATGELFAPNAYLRITTDGLVTVLVPKSEMGQGAMTAVPMIVAEELDVDWAKVTGEAAPADKEYRWTFGTQMTGGSDTVRRGFDILRKAGAIGRALLVQAAANTWGVPVDQCATSLGTVIHAASGKSLGYGALAARAATLKPPEKVVFKDAKTYRLIGKPLARPDSPPKVQGKAMYGIDKELPGMLVACVMRSPIFEGKVGSFDGSAALKIPGVRHVKQISNGVAVIADGYWPARKGVEALAVKWAGGKLSNLSSEAIEAAYKQAAKHPEKTLREVGRPEAITKAAQARLDAEFWTPYLAHAAMEPLNCTADVRPDGCDLWVGTQNQTGSQLAAMKVTGLPEEKVAVHTMLLGGGFGRRGETDFVTEAVELSKALGVPIKVVWSRGDDMAMDYYRPATLHRLSGSLDAEGFPVAWHHLLVTPSVLDRAYPMAKLFMGKDPVVTEGADDPPYHFPHFKMEVKYLETGVPVGFWRSVSHSHNAFAVECFVDELAALGGKDPLEVRRRLLAHNPRQLAVVELAAEKAGWGTPLPKGRYRGIAACAPFGSFVAQVVELSLSDSGVKVHRVVCAVDCGLIVNPAIVEAQMEGGIVYGLSAALQGEITLKDGRVQQSNFHDYPVLRMSDMPAIQVYLVPSQAAPGGAGEIGVPCVAPAIANAVRAAIGKPIRRLPIRPFA